MAFKKTNLTIVTNNVKAGYTPSLWAYYNEDGDNVTSANYFEEQRLTVGDLIMVYSAASLGRITYRVSAKSTDTFTATATALAAQPMTASTVETITVATNLYDEISNQSLMSLLVTKNANVAATFTTSATAENFITLSQNIYDGVHVVLTTATTLPAGLALATNYYAVSSNGNKCKLSLTRGGTPVAITGAGTGAHTATVQKNYFILKDGYESQRKIIKVKTDGGVDAVILPDNLKDGTIITAGDALDAMELVFADGQWQIVKNIGVAAS